MPASLAQKLESLAGPDSGSAPDLDAGELAVAHGHLAQIVAPATPRTILLLDRESAKRGFWFFLGPVSHIRRMMLATILFLATFIATSTCEEVTGNVNVSVEHGKILFLNELFLLAAAGLGACFAALYQANRYIAEGTFDPKYEASYWIRIFMGVIAGLLLAVLLPLDSLTDLQMGGSQAFGADSDSTGQGETAKALNLAMPTLAMLGGFSATVVYRMLNRVVEALETLVRGDTRDILNAREQAAQARLAEQVTQSRMQLATRLVSLQQQLGAGTGAEEVSQKLSGLLEELLPYGPEGEKQAGASGKEGSKMPVAVQSQDAPE
ncbi:MAG: hypothetical protein HWE39_08985 [Oceanospirillaceae bacterium]|nr:hypothetical protein [Oceanospirillaceae bacterium]